MPTRHCLASLLAFLTACGSPDVDSGADAGTAFSYAPIYVVVNAHGHNYGFPPESADDPDFTTLKAQAYQRHKAEILWLADEAEAYGAKMSYQLNGEYSRDARVLMDDVAHIRELVARGHSIGTHFHPFAFTGMNEYWRQYPNRELTPEIVAEIWASHISEVEAALGAEIVHIDAATPRETDEEHDTYAALMAEHGLAIEVAPEHFTWTDWNHKPWNPYRRKHRTQLSEDRAAPWFSIPSFPQVGEAQPQGLHAVSTSVPQLQRHFLQTLASWSHAQTSGETPRIWSFGIMTHPSQNAMYRQDMTTMLSWLASFRDLRGPGGQPVVEFVTREELAGLFAAWEQAYPDVSSFDFDWEGWLAGDDVPYPYPLEGMVRALLDCELVADLKLSSEGVLGWELVRRRIERGPRQPGGQVAITYTDELMETVYLLWAEQDNAIVDLSERVSGTVNVVLGTTGELTTVDAAAVPVGRVPVVVTASP